MRRLPPFSFDRTPLGFSALLSGAVLLGSLANVAGCKSAQAPPDDATLASTVNSQLAADSSIAGQPIQVSVQNSVATLNGSVSNDAQRTIAARDAAGVRGVREVINNLGVGVAPAMAASAPPPAQRRGPNSRVEAQREQNYHEPAPIQREQPVQQTAQQPAPSQTFNNQPPPPVFKTVTIPAGTTIPVRVTQTLDSASTQPGQSFSGVVASEIVIDGLVAVPQGSAVTGNVDAVQEAAHFKGSSLLTVSLTGIKSRGERLAVTSDPYSVKGNGRGKNTAEKAGGGAAVGAILGGIFGGGKGAAIGAAAGGGVGAGANAVTRGQQVQIPSETVVRFHTASSITVRVRTDGGHDHDRDGSSDPDLQHRPS